MAIYTVFGVGVGNLGHGRMPRRTMAQWVEMLNRHLSQGHPVVRIVGSFGHTGNFLADSVSTDLDEVTAGFKRLLETGWVVRPIDDVRGALTALSDMQNLRARTAFDGPRDSPFMGGKKSLVGLFRERTEPSSGKSRLILSEF